MQKTNQLIEKVIHWAQKKGYKTIKANCDDYETPTQYTPKGEDESIIPDVTGTKLGTKSFFEVATKTDDIPAVISKWKLLSTLAAMKGGKLFLLAPKGHKAFTEDIAKQHLTNAEVIYLKNA